MVKIKSLTAGYGKVEVVKNVNITLNEGEITGIIGASGSGKSTFLKTLAAKVVAFKGSLQIDTELIDLSEQLLVAERKSVYLVDQEFDLMPYLNVFDNIKKNHLHLSEATIKKGVAKSARHVKLAKQKEQQAKTLSGGQKQRTALAAAFLGDAALCLFDEPFSHLDFDLKQQVRALIKEQSAHRHTLIALHEPADFLSLCDTLVVLKNGRILQQGSPFEIYHHPKNQYVAGLSGYYCCPSDALLAEFSFTKTSIIRPDHLEISKKKGIDAVVQRSVHFGMYYLIDVEVKGENLLVFNNKALAEGTKVKILKSENAPD